MHAFCCRAHAEPFCGLLILDKIIRQQSGEILIFYRSDPGEQLLIHRIDVVTARRQIVRRIIFALFRFSCIFNGNLKCSIETGNISHNIYIIQCFKFTDSHRIRIPDFRIDRTGFIL